MTKLGDTMPQRAAIFGVGSMGTRYMAMLADTYGLSTDDIFLTDLPATVHKWKQSPVGQAHHWFKSPTDLREQLEGWPLDLAIISTPADTHVELLAEVASLFPTAAVLVEKPLTNGRLDDLVGYLSPTLFTRHIAVGYNWRFHPWVRQLAMRADEITNLSLYVAEDMRNWPGVRYGMPLYEFSHEFDMVRLLLTNPEVMKVTVKDDRYSVFGEHERGHWRVVIRSSSTPIGRWFRMRLENGLGVSGHWPTDSATIEQTYASQLSNVVDTMDGDDGPTGLECPLWEGVGTAHFVDSIASRL